MADPQDADALCEVCDPLKNPTAWTPGVPCGPNEVCAEQACSSPDCEIEGAPYQTGDLNPADPCQACNPHEAGPSQWTPLTGAGPADGGCVCAAGACVSACFIDGGLVDAGTFAPAVACAACQPAASTVGWSPFTGAPEPGTCPAGDECRSGLCVCPPGCRLDGGEGCCDPITGLCRAVGSDAACAAGGACQACASGEHCVPKTDGGFFCCTPGNGCGYSCGDPNLLDGCGLPCPVNCPATSCCDANGDCQPGTTVSACGSGGSGAALCTDCGAFPCIDQSCGCKVGVTPCDSQQCLSGTITTTTCFDGGKFSKDACTSLCCSSGTCETCVAGTCQP
jgi:hypothetical protein